MTHLNEAFELHVEVEAEELVAATEAKHFLIERLSILDRKSLHSSDPVLFKISQSLCLLLHSLSEVLDSRTPIFHQLPTVSFSSFSLTNMFVNQFR